MKMAARKALQESNSQAAWIILNDPDRYAGLPLLWAEAYVKQHGLDRQHEAGEGVSGVRK
jgi:hypothetical protein